MERANAREQRALSHLLQVRGEAHDARIADLHRQRDMEQQRTDALSHEQNARSWANYVEAGA